MSCDHDVEPACCSLLFNITSCYPRAAVMSIVSCRSVLFRKGRFFWEDLCVWDLCVWDSVCVCGISESEIRVGKWPQTTKPDDGVICGFCPLAMPSAASQLISFDLFSSGLRNGFDLASSCYGSFSLLVGMICLTFCSCYAGVPVGFQLINREYSSH